MKRRNSNKTRAMRQTRTEAKRPAVRMNAATQAVYDSLFRKPKEPETTLIADALDERTRQVCDAWKGTPTLRGVTLEEAEKARNARVFDAWRR